MMNADLMNSHLEQIKSRSKTKMRQVTDCTNIILDETGCTGYKEQVLYYSINQMQA